MTRKRIRILFAFVLIVVLIWSAISIYRATKAVLSLNESRQRIELVLGEGLMRADATELENIALNVRGDILVLRSVAGPVAELAPLFKWLPKYGPILAHGPELLEMADLGSEAGLYVARAAGPALTALQNSSGEDGRPIPAITRSLASSSADFVKASETFEQLIVVRESMTETEKWPAELQRILTQVDGLLPVAQDALILGRVLPEMLGSREQRNYLVMAQNEDELRPAGGFISGAGILVVENGDILSLDFEDAYLLDDWQNKPYGFPPLPFNEFMGMDIFLFRDANFWPDFPTSAKTAMQLYSYGQEVPLDGIIAFNQHFVQTLLETTGPMQIPELELSVNSNNAIEAMRLEWGPADGQSNWIAERKAFMGPFAHAIIGKITSDFQSLDLLDLGRTIHTSIAQRDLQIFMRDPIEAEALTDAGWDGRLTTKPDQDYLMVVESNLGFNKANVAVERSVSYKLALDESGQGSAELNIVYDHNGIKTDEGCRQGKSYNTDTKYEDLIQDCYWNYLRVLVPSNSHLIEASNHPVSAEHLLIDRSWDGLARAYANPSGDYSYFDNFILLSSGQSTSVYFSYLLPKITTTDTNGVNRYQLAVDKQSGIGNQPLTIALTLPVGSKFISSNPEPDFINGLELMFELDLIEDHQINVQYR